MSPSSLSAQSPSACAVSLSWSQAQPAQGTFRLVRKISPGGSQTFDLPEITPSGNAYSCTDNNFTQNVAAGGGCGNSVWNGYDPNTTVFYQIEFCPSGGTCSPVVPSSAVSVSTIALPAAPKSPLPPSSQPASWQPQGTFAYAKTYGSGSQITLNFQNDPSQPLSGKFKNYGGFIIDRSSTGGNSDAGFPKFVPATSVSITDLGGGKFSLSYSENVNTGTAYTYSVKLYESDQYCKPSSDANQLASSVPLSVTVPTTPTKFSAVSSISQGISVALSWTKPSGTNKFWVQRSNDPTFPEGKSGTNTIATGISDSQFTDTSNLASFTTYYYRVAACSNPAGGCSDFASAQVTTGAVISNPVASIQSAGTTNASVLISWNSEGNFTKIWVERTDTATPGSAPTVINCANNGLNNYCVDSNAILGKVYSYQVKGQSVSPVKNPAPVVLSLNFTPIKGWGFGFTSTPNDTTARGIGWIRLSNDSTSSVWGVDTNPPDLADDKTAGGVPYTLSVDKDTGLISGFAWSGLDCAAKEDRPNGSACGYGWLGFSLSASDLTHCPDAQSRQTGDTCQAKVDLTTGKIDGWAKFTSADVSKGAWDGWVSLRGDTYGVCYGDAAKDDGTTCTGNGSAHPILSGWAWGSEVGGWINFGALIPPVLNTVTSMADGKSATLNWSNGMNYSSVEIWMSNSADPNCKDPTSSKCTYLKSDKNSLDSSAFQKSTNGFDKNATVPGLNTGATYGFFIRAYP
ncbi:MAG: fibronectin type III domain-containing protein [Minisyncoccia bacterium]